MKAKAKIIEIDGISHNHKRRYDLARQEYLESLGFHFCRFIEQEVIKNSYGILLELTRIIKKIQPPNPLF